MALETPTLTQDYTLVTRESEYEEQAYVSSPVPSPTSAVQPNNLLPAEYWPKINHLITEDDTPVDNIFLERQQRLLTDALDSSWTGPEEGRPFLALVNVALYYGVNEAPLVPDMMLSLDVLPPQKDIWKKGKRSYLNWEYAKAPEVVIEIVSNRVGDEEGGKLQKYARAGVFYYVIFDPKEYLSPEQLRIYALTGPGTYTKMGGTTLPKVGLSLTRWYGEYASTSQDWLRWCDLQGDLIPTGAERARSERQQKELFATIAQQERLQKEQALELVEEQRSQKEQALELLEQERQQKERLVARLRALGIELEEE